MIRYRQLWDDYASNDNLASLTDGEERLFWGLWATQTITDDWGNFRWKAKKILLGCLPGRKRWNFARVAKTLKALQTKKMLAPYEVNGKKYGHLCGFVERTIVGTKHRRSSHCPPYSEEECGAARSDDELCRAMQSNAEECGAARSDALSADNSNTIPAPVPEPVPTPNKKDPPTPPKDPRKQRGETASRLTIAYQNIHGAVSATSANRAILAALQLGVNGGDIDEAIQNAPEGSKPWDILGPLEQAKKKAAKQKELRPWH